MKTKMEKDFFDHLKQLPIWPSGYPEVLKECSWAINGIAGPYRVFNTHMTSSNKHHKLLLINIVRKYFENNIGHTIPPQVEILCKYFARSFSVIYINDNFIIRNRKIFSKKNGEVKDAFNEEDWNIKCEKIDLNEAGAAELLQHLKDATLAFYNKLVMSKLK